MTTLKLHNQTDPAIDNYITQLADMPTEKLVEEFRKQFALAVAPLVKVAAVWAELERKGYDMSELKEGRALFIPHIAHGTVKPELVVAFHQTPSLLKKLAALPPSEQEKHIRGEPVKVVVKDGSRFDTRMMLIRDLTPPLLKQVFNDKAQAIRDEREQIALLSTPAAPANPGRLCRQGRVEVDRATSHVRIGASYAPINDVIGALRAAGFIT